MKLKTIITVLAIALVLNTYSQNDKVNDELFGFALKKYENATRYNDVYTSISALNEMLLLKPEEKKYKENLLNLYFSIQSYTSVKILADEMEAEGSTSLLVYEALAFINKNSNKPNEALAYYEKMNAVKENINVLYEIGLLNFSLKKYDACSEALDKVLANPESSKIGVVVANGKGGEQKVPMDASVFNVAALMANAKGSNEDALYFLDEALKIYPKFELAKLNLNSLEASSSTKE